MKKPRDGGSGRSKELLKKFLPYLKRHRRMLFFDLFCASLTTVCEIVLPLIVRRITDAAAVGMTGLTVSLIVKTVSMYIVLRLIDAAASYYMNSRGHFMGTKIETDMRNDLFAHLQEMPFSFFDNTKTGQLMSRLTSDLFDITEFAHHAPEEFFITAIKVVACFAIFMSMNVWLAIIVFAALPLMFIMTKQNRDKMNEAFKASRHSVGEINAQAEDSLLGIRVVKAFTGEALEKQKFRENAGLYYDIKARSYRFMGRFQTTVRLFDGLMYIICVAAGAVFLRRGMTTLGDFTASLLMVSTLVGSVRRLIEFSEQFSRGMTGIERFAEIMDKDSEPGSGGEGVALEKCSGDIELRDISFKYEGTDSYVFEHLNLHIKKGETVAIVGPSGGGKTTICSLIPRFYLPDSGEILLDGLNVRDIKLKSLRAAVGVVQQDVYLFSGSVIENIRYGRPDATDEEIFEAAKQAGAHDFILGLPNGYETNIGERGVKLSGGQKQRLSIARVFLKNPPVLILDEATSALDNESERLVQQSLEALSKGRTTLVIAHRLTTIKNASVILVLTENGIEEQGSHDELVKSGGVYSRMYAMYEL